MLVAIADVDSLVDKGSAIDGHARQNTTSVYTAAKLYSMLPERLSWDLTSLIEAEDRLSVVFEMVLDPDGEILGSDVYRATVRNRAKLAYDAVAAWLEGEAEPPNALATVAGLEETLRLQDRAAQSLREKRHRNGALDLETSEPRAVFSDGHARRPRRAAQEPGARADRGPDDRRQRHLGPLPGTPQGSPSLRRVLRSPERWGKIAGVAMEYGVHLPDEPDAAALEAFLVKAKRADPERFPDLSLTIVKLMGSGEYAVETEEGDIPGHFGLAVKAYTHSTAPNRRYPDLITQRLLKAVIDDRAIPYSLGELRELARHCTEQEDDADKIERQVRKSAAALLLEGKKGQRFDAIVTGASHKGTWVRIFRPPVEGKVVRGFRGLDVGDRTQVELLGTDVERGWIDFARVED